MVRVYTATVALVAMLACPIGTVVCRLQCLTLTSDLVAPRPCEHHGASPAATLRAETLACDELDVVLAVKPERVEDPRGAAVQVHRGAVEPPLGLAEQRGHPVSRPPPEPSFTGTDLPLRI